MKATIYPSKLKNQKLMIPPSKSLAHRAVICAALANGVSHISRIEYSEDICATLEAVKALGAKVRCGLNDVIIEGISSLKKEMDVTIDCNESGSTLRFLIPLLSMTERKITFTGKGRLMQRPQSVYEAVFEKNGALFLHNHQELIIHGKLKAGTYHLRGDVSSQFISGLLFALPLEEMDSKLVIEGPFESQSYVALTIQMLSRFGISIDMKEKEILIPGRQTYQPQNVEIESDYSQAVFFAALGALHQPVTCQGLDRDSLQGDRVFVKIFEQMNIHFEEFNNEITFYPSEIKGTEIDLSDCPDLGPALMMLASFCNQETKFVNAGRLRMKESDRIASIQTELRKCGVEVISSQDSVWIRGKEKWSISEPFYGHQDHRIVMALAIGAVAMNTSVVLEGAEAVNKSYPGFFDDLKSLGVNVLVE